MKKRMSSVLAALTVVCLMSQSGAACAAWKGDWELSDDGKRWRYLYSADEPAQDEWIEYDGKEYYVDSRGYLKTGWVTDAWDGSRYYTGPDGAKCYNMFTADDCYIGPEGTVLEEFDKYRRAIKKQLFKVMDDKAYMTPETAERPGFLLTDLNGDGYRDLIIVNRPEHPGRVLLAAVWDPAKEALILAAEADLNGEDMSALACNPDTQSVWLVITDHSRNHIGYFRMADGGTCFDSVWNFTIRTDDWGDPEYEIDGMKAEPEEWLVAAAAADDASGAAVEDGYLPLEKSQVTQAVDRAPAPEELSLWEL